MGCVSCLEYSVAFSYHMDQENVSQVGEAIVYPVESRIDPPSDQLLSQKVIVGFELEALLIP